MEDILRTSFVRKHRKENITTTAKIPEKRKKKPNWKEKKNGAILNSFYGEMDFVNLSALTLRRR